MRSRFTDDDASAAVQRWAPRAPDGEDLALRVYTSRLLGEDPTLVLHGGGNTSLKGRKREIAGAETDVLYVKGSGWDLATIEPRGFPACRLAPLLECLALPDLADEDMVRALRSQMLDPASPTPSVEALLHAFLPARYVDHTHANAVLAVVDQPDGEARARDVWGDGLVFVPYVMPGFLLARAVAALGPSLAAARVMVLGKHGIFTWGATARDSYEQMIQEVTRAEDYVARKRLSVASDSAEVARSGRRAGDGDGTTDATTRARRKQFLSPLVRGALARAPGGGAFVLEWRDEPAILELLAHADARRLTQIGPMTPDHVIRTKPLPAWLGDVPLTGADSAVGAVEPTDGAVSAAEPGDGAVVAARDAARHAVEAELVRYAAEYTRYFTLHSGRSPAPLTRLDALPRLFVAPGLGVLAAGKTLDDARAAGDIYAHTAQVILDAAAIGSYEPVPAADLFDVEYWSLEQAKLKVTASAGGPLARRIALVTGAARGIGQAVAEHFLSLGAAVVLSDVDGDALEETARQLATRHGTRVASARADVTQWDSARALAGEAVRAFGGLDIVVSNAGNAPSGLLHTPEGDAALRRSLELNFLGHQNVARAACEVLLAQGTGGCLLFNASKSAFNPGKDFGPYAVPKAAVVALMKQYAVDLGAQGIRANAVNADRIRTALFDGIVESRAKARGVSPDEYFKDNLLRRETRAEDVARAFGYLAVAEATTGAVVPVDGGNAAAFPR